MNLKPREKIEGLRIILQKPTVSFVFAEQMFSAIDNNREHILPWLDWALPTVTKSAEDDFVFAYLADKDWEIGKRFEYSIYETETGKFIGGLGVIKISKDIDGIFEIGYWLCEDACGKGYMQEAVRLIEKELFDLGAERIIIRNDVENIKSRMVAINSGYQFEGCQRHGKYSVALQKFVDINVFSKIRSDFVK